MLQKLQKRKESGFTIIEVLIVLAIAGLILLIVFLAVPALERNAHNTSIKNDAANILGGVSEFVDNNNGTLPSSASVSGGTATLSGTGLNSSTAKVGYITVVSVVDGSKSVPSLPAIGTLDIVTSATCSGNAPTSTSISRNYAAYYQLEGGAAQCQTGG